ncbi:two-component system response regulator YesN [Paenibacillus rhizosphaerae]|uniref:Two-component system response regulator YesN n=1 Tax=Paenibacillus rhizosphaerae TaxID=297318 RepID=A0A839TJS1_9BACL|nr:response regulator [Paenibacillus rhizosphaerae]MBB3127036.1 two-component system response regulator YesN [Paenibacillus rhizosphaerae]
MLNLQMLVVDDENYVVESIADTISWFELGIDTVHKAYSGAEALEIMSLYSIDIVIADIRMPGMSGLELIDNIRSTWKQVKCILLSGHSEFEYARRAITLSTFDYLLKPVKDEVLIKTVRNAIEALNLEWEQITKHARSSYLIKENMPSLQARLLGDLLLGRKIRSEVLKDRLTMFELSFDMGDACCLLLIRMEDEFLSVDSHSLALLEYAVTNIADEIFNDVCRIWHCKDSFEHIAVLIRLNREKEEEYERLGKDEEWRRQLIERLTIRLQGSIRNFLKGKVTILISGWGKFPDDLRSTYLKSLTTLRKRAGGDKDYIIREDASLYPEPLENMDSKSRQLQSLYEPPTLQQLLDTGRWNEARRKLEDVCKELAEQWPGSLDHISEAYLSIAGSFSYIIHRNNRQPSEVLEKGNDIFCSPYSIRSASQLREWALEILKVIENDMEKEVRYSRAHIVKKAQQFIEDNLSSNISLKAVADHVHVHYTHLCKIYKLETGENLSDYLYRLRMEWAVYFLKNSEDKIYEIGAKLGYQNIPYFIKVFKQHYGMTPQEYRELE